MLRGIPIAAPRALQLLKRAAPALEQGEIQFAEKGVDDNRLTWGRGRQAGRGNYGDVEVGKGTREAAVEWAAQAGGRSAGYPAVNRVLNCIEDWIA